MVGRQPGTGAQRISIGNGCGYLGVVAHEIGMKVSVIIIIEKEIIIISNRSEQQPYIPVTAF